jgi:serine/threonine protein kinase/predicted Zn-dependent protease
MIGEKILHYKIVEKLGEGGMGVVYLAEDTKLKRQVAIKFLPPQMAVNGEEQERFKIEAQAAAALNHPNITQIYAIEESDDELFIVMEYVSGQELKSAVGAIGSVAHNLDTITGYAEQIALGLQAAHEKDIIHRDIKTSNIMITDKGQVKIMDFGLAKVGKGIQITKEQSTLGTAPYMSPEQIQGDNIDHRSDIWSYGVVLYEMLTGALPFKGEYEQAVIFNILNEQPADPNKINAEINDSLNNIVLNCLQKDPDERYQGMSQVIDELEGSSEADPLSQKRTKTLPKPISFKTKNWIWATVTVVVLTVIFGYLITDSENEPMTKLPIAVADFENQTIEPELNGLSGLLITALEQSNRLSVITRSRMIDILKQLDKSDIKYIDENLGTEICKKANIGALAVASIRKLGNRYVIDLKVIDPKKDEYLFTAKEEGEGQESVFAMIDNLAEKTRVGLKEKAEQIDENKQNVADVVTTNLEAYQHYFKGEELISKVKFKEAEEEFRKAIAIDTSFALAYYRLAYAIVWWGGQRAKEPIRKAMQYVHNVPQKERLYIESMNDVIHNNIDQALQRYNKILEIYPDEKEALYQLGDWSFHTTDYDAALEYLNRVLSIDPLFESAYQHTIWTYWTLGQYDKALEYCQLYISRIPGEQSYGLLGATYCRKNDLENAFNIYKQALDFFPGSTLIISDLGNTYIYSNEYKKAEIEFKKLVHHSMLPHEKSKGFLLLAVLNAYLGKYRETLKMIDKKIEIDIMSSDSTNLAADYAEKAFWTLAGLNQRDKAKEVLESAIRLERLGDESFYRPLINYYTILEDYQSALTLLRTDLTWDPIHVIVVNAYLDKSHGKFQDAIEGFQKANLIGKYRSPASYELGEMYFELGQYENAIKAIKKMQVTNQNYDSYPLRALQYSKSFYLLGQIYEKKREEKLAIENYIRFLELWKDADEDLPELNDAKERLEKLKRIAIN